MATPVRVPELGRERARRLRAPVAVAGGIGLATVALLLRDPHRHGSWGLCPFKALTGWDCPLCGGLRAVNDLGHARWSEAAHSNLLFVASLPLLVGLWVWWSQRAWTGREAARPERRGVRPALVAYAVVAVVFTVYRNTPWGAAWYAA